MRFPTRLAIAVTALRVVLIPTLLVLAVRQLSGWQHGSGAATLVLLAVYLVWIYLGAAWAYLNYWGRYILPPFFLTAGLLSIGSARPPAPDSAVYGLWWVLPLLLLALTLYFLILVAACIQGRRYRGVPIGLRRPLEGRRFYVLQGGSNASVNYHGRFAESQRYALDIVALSAAGTRAASSAPRRAEEYWIHGAPLLCPCDGLVVESADGCSDEPRAGGAAEGNHVWIQSGDAYILMAHLSKGSVLVRVGEQVVAGQPVGRVGASGNATEPHLHIHAVRPAADPSQTMAWRLAHGEPVPLLIDGEFLVRNQTFGRRQVGDLAEEDPAHRRQARGRHQDGLAGDSGQAG